MSRPHALDSLPVHAILTPPAPSEYLVRPSEDLWLIEHEGDAYGPYKDCREAMFFAIDAAHKYGVRGRRTQVRAIDHSGHAVGSWIYGTDPYPPSF